MNPTTTPTLSPRFAEAVAYAIDVHDTQTRKGSNTPYICHLLQVAGLVIEAGGDPDTQIAALLHDAAEDQGGESRLADIAKRFGERVANLVRGCSDSLDDVDAPKAAWRERKEAYLNRLALNSTDPGVVLIALADKLHNARATINDLRIKGASTWDKFKVGKSDHLWYLREALIIATNRNSDMALRHNLAEAITTLDRGEESSQMDAAK